MKIPFLEFAPLVMKLEETRPYFNDGKVRTDRKGEGYHSGEL